MVLLGYNLKIVPATTSRRAIIDFRHAILSSLESNYHTYVRFEVTSVILNFIFVQLFLGILVTQVRGSRFRALMLKLRPQHFESDQICFNVNRTIERELSFFLCLKIALSEDI